MWNNQQTRRKMSPKWYVSVGDIELENSSARGSSRPENTKCIVFSARGANAR